MSRSTEAPITRVYQFAGLASNSSPHALPPSAATEQINIQCLYPGALTVRPGIAVENFDNAGNYPSWPDTPGSSLSYPAVTMCRLRNSGNDWAVWQTSDGSVFAKLGAD